MTTGLDDLAQPGVHALDCIRNRHDIARYLSVPADLAYGVPIRDRGTWEHEAWAGRCTR